MKSIRKLMKLLLRDKKEERHQQILRQISYLEEQMSKLYTRLSLLDQYWSHSEIRALMMRTVAEYVKEEERMKRKQEAFKAQYEKDLAENTKVFLSEEMEAYKSFENKPDKFDKI